MKEPLTIYNFNAPNYSVLNAKYDYFRRVQGKSGLAPVHEIMGVDFAKGIATGHFKVYKIYLPNGNVAWKVSSTFFPRKYIFLLNPIVSDYVVEKNGIKYYGNICLNCEKEITSFEPIPKIRYQGYENAIYICPECQKKVEVHGHNIEMQRKKEEPNTLEREIAKILDDLGITYEREKAFNFGYFSKVVDFYIPCGKVIVEGNGLAYHTSAVKSKYESKYGKEAFFVSVLKDVVSAYELTTLGYYVYIITDYDLTGKEKGSITPKTLSPEQIEYLKYDLAELLSLRGCHPHTDFDVFKDIRK